MSWAEAPDVPLRVDTMPPDLRSATEDVASPSGIHSGPVVRTRCFTAMVLGSVPGWELRSCSQKKKKKDMDFLLKMMHGHSECHQGRLRKLRPGKVGVHWRTPSRPGSGGIRPAAPHGL